MLLSLSIQMISICLATYCSPFDGDSADWMVEVPTKRIYKLQVKWTRRSKRGGAPFIPLCSYNRKNGKSTSRRLTKEDFDFIIGYDLHKDKAYVFTFEETKNYKSRVTVTDNACEAWDKLLK